MTSHDELPDHWTPHTLTHLSISDGVHAKIYAEEYALAAIAPYKLANEQFDKRCRVLDEKLFDAEARVAELEETQRKFGIVQHEILRRAEEAEAALAAECEVNTLHQAEIAHHMAEVARLRELLRNFPGRSCGEATWNEWCAMRAAALKEKP